MTINELIAAARKKGPWRVDGNNRIRTVAEPTMCPITAVAGGKKKMAFRTGVYDLRMTVKDVANVMEAADISASRLKTSDRTEPAELRRQLEQQLVGLS